MTPRFQISLRRVFAFVTIVAILAAWSVANWRRVQERREFLRVAGAINGHPRTVQSYRTRVDRTSIKWIFFGHYEIVYMNLYPGTFDDGYLAHAQELFPETKIISSSDQNAGDDIPF
jgi:hypothetical protein